MSDDKRKMPEAVLSRLKQSASRYHGGYQALSLASQVPLGTLQKLLSGASEPRFTIVIDLCRTLQISLDWVATGVEGESMSSTWEGQLDQVAFGEKRIAVYDVFASAGFGNDTPEEKPEAYLTFPLKWLNDLGNPDEMNIIKIQGDSMEPELRSGDLVLVDYSQRDLRDGLFAISIDDMLYVKRLEVKGRHKARVVSTNPAYESLEISLSGSDDVNQSADRIVGRVVWAGRAL